MGKTHLDWFSIFLIPYFSVIFTASFIYSLHCLAVCCISIIVRHIETILSTFWFLTTGFSSPWLSSCPDRASWCVQQVFPSCSFSATSAVWLEGWHCQSVHHLGLNWNISTTIAGTAPSWSSSDQILLTSAQLSSPPTQPSSLASEYNSLNAFLWIDIKFGPVI